MTRRLLPLLVLPALVLLPLAGCSLLAPAPPNVSAPDPANDAQDDDDEPAGNPPIKEPPEPSAGGSCLEGEWSADVAQLAQSYTDYFTSLGLTVSGTTGEGAQTLVVDGDELRVDSDLYFVTSTTLGESVIRTAQQHAGSVEATWEVTADDVLELSDLDSDYALTTFLEIEGVFTESPYVEVELAPDGSDIEYSCDGDELTTSNPGYSGVLTVWTRVD